MMGEKSITHLLARLGHPREAQLIGQDSSGNRGAIIPSPSNEHHTQLGNMLLCAEG